MEPHKHPFPNAFRWALSSSLHASLGGGRHDIGWIHVSPRELTRRQTIEVSEQHVTLTFGGTTNGEYFSYSNRDDVRRVKQQNDLDQAVESAFVSALLLLGKVRGIHHKESGLVQLYMSDIEANDQRWTVSFGVRFVASKP